MPVFNAHIPRGKFTRERKIAIGNALNLSLNKALGIPGKDIFVAAVHPALNSSSLVYF